MAIGLNHNTQITRPGEEIFLQVGSIFGNARATAPNGYLKCDGSLISRTDYPRLFAVIGTTYGSTNSDNFALPDLDGVVPRGAGTSKGFTFNPTIALGLKTDDAIQGHRHIVDSHSHGGGNHSHSIGDSSNGSGDSSNSTDSSPSRNGIWYTDASGNIIGSEAPSTGEASSLSNGAPRIQSETRVKSLGINFFIKF